MVIQPHSPPQQTLRNKKAGTESSNIEAPPPPHPPSSQAYEEGVRLQVRPSLGPSLGHSGVSQSPCAASPRVPEGPPSLSQLTPCRRHQ